MKSSAALFGPREELRRLIAGKMMGRNHRQSGPTLPGTVDALSIHRALLRSGGRHFLGGDRAAFMTAGGSEDT